MKKTIIMLTILSLSATASFAATISAGGSVATTGTPAVTIGKVSNKVLGTIISSATAFSILLKHTNGTREYATSSIDPKIYWNAVTATNKGTATMGLTLNTSDTSQFNTWTAL